MIARATRSWYNSVLAANRFSFQKVDPEEQNFDSLFELIDRRDVDDDIDGVIFVNGDAFEQKPHHAIRKCRHSFRREPTCSLRLRRARHGERPASLLRRRRTVVQRLLKVPRFAHCRGQQPAGDAAQLAHWHLNESWFSRFVSQVVFLLSKAHHHPSNQRICRRLRYESNLYEFTILYQSAFFQNFWRPHHSGCRIRHQLDDGALRLFREFSVTRLNNLLYFWATFQSPW